MIDHAHHIRVYFEDTDAGGVMYHAAYLGFAERARTEALRDAGLPHAAMLTEHGVMFMVRSLQMEYLRPARLDDMLTIRTTTLAATGASVTLAQDFFCGEATLARARVMLVCVRQATGSAARIPPRWRDALARPRPALAASGEL
jgi:acyl-CoA thioester hydrolase